MSQPSNWKLLPPRELQFSDTLFGWFPGYEPPWGEYWEEIRELSLPERLDMVVRADRMEELGRLLQTSGADFYGIWSDENFFRHVLHLPVSLAEVLDHVQLNVPRTTRIVHFVPHHGPQLPFVGPKRPGYSLRRVTPRLVNNSELTVQPMVAPIGKLPTLVSPEKWNEVSKILASLTRSI